MTACPGQNWKGCAPSVRSARVPEIPWLLDLFTATRKGTHEPGQWQPDDRRRRATIRMLGRTTVLYGTDTSLTWTEMVESAVVFSDAPQNDPVLAEHRGSRGLARGAAAELFGQRVAAAVGCAGSTIGQADDSADRSAEDLQTWLAGQMPGMTVRAFMADLPPGMTGTASCSGRVDRAGRRQHQGPADQRHGSCSSVPGAHRTWTVKPARCSWGGRARSSTRCGWPAVVREFEDRPLRDLAVRLVNDMLAQARRVALDKMRPDSSGRLQVYSRIHERNGRYYKTRDEGDTTIGTRLEVMAGIAVQLGLIDVADDDAATVTGKGSAVLEVGA